MNNLQKRQQGFLGKKPGAPTTKERYVKHPYFCPFCEHPVIEATKLEAFENIVIQWVRCDKCETEWHDIYELIDYEEVEVNK